VGFFSVENVAASTAGSMSTLPPILDNYQVGWSLVHGWGQFGRNNQSHTGSATAIRGAILRAPKNWSEVMNSCSATPTAMGYLSEETHVLRAEIGDRPKSGVERGEHAKRSEACFAATVWRSDGIWHFGNGPKQPSYPAKAGQIIIPLDQEFTRKSPCAWWRKAQRALGQPFIIDRSQAAAGRSRRGAWRGRRPTATRCWRR